MVPFVRTEDEIFLKTVIPSLKMNKLYKEHMMKMDEYELGLLEAVEKASEFSRVEDFEDELDEAKRASRNFLKKTKNINIRIPEFDMLILKRKSVKPNIPYQMILSLLIHQYVTDKIKLTL